MFSSGQLSPTGHPAFVAQCAILQDVHAPLTACFHTDCYVCYSASIIGVWSASQHCVSFQSLKSHIRPTKVVQTREGERGGRGGRAEGVARGRGMCMGKSEAEVHQFAAGDVRTLWSASYFCQHHEHRA